MGCCCDWGCVERWTYFAFVRAAVTRLQRGAAFYCSDGVAGDCFAARWVLREGGGDGDERYDGREEGDVHFDVVCDGGVAGCGRREEETVLRMFSDEMERGCICSCSRRGIWAHGFL